MSFVKYEPKGNIAYLIIDREKALNALNSQVLADLDAALDAVDLSGNPQNSTPNPAQKARKEQEKVAETAEIPQT